MDSRLLQIWLAEKNAVLPVRSVLLGYYFGSIEEIYAAGLEDYRQIEDIPKAAAVALCDKSLDAAQKIVSDCEKLGIGILTCRDKEFPQALRTISTPVQVLYYKGELPDWEEILGIAVVGTRRCSEYGQMASERISGELAEAGVTVISGMARGIDSYALKAALRAGGKTIAVMGCGLDSAYPPENSSLMEEIIENGCALSEYPPYSPPLKAHFPVRNRIVCGISDGVLAVEAPQPSGTLITANLARDSGKPLFAVPGNIFNRNSKGTNYLIKNYAQAVTCAKDILDAYPIRASRLTAVKKEQRTEKTPQKPAEESGRLAGLPEPERVVAQILMQQDMHIEEIAARSGIKIAELNTILPMLEINGIVQRLAGSRYKYVPDEE